MNELLCGDCEHYNGRTLCCKMRYTEGELDIAICIDFERIKNMETKNLEITVKLNGREVPLDTISTETFEAIKTLEKSKEIPVARVGNYKGHPQDRRLFLKITDSIRQNVARATVGVIVIDLKNGNVNNIWRSSKEEENLGIYENIRSL